METTPVILSPPAFSNLLKTEWHLQADFVRIRKVPLKELGVSDWEVNWLLNTVEWKYGLSIDEPALSLQVTPEEIFQLILKACKKGA